MDNITVEALTKLESNIDTIRHEKRTQDDDLVDLRNSDEADIVKQEHLTLGPPETSDQPRPSRRRTRWSRKSTAVVARENADDSEPIQVELFSRLVRIEENLSLDNLMQLKSKWDSKGGVLNSRAFYNAFAELHKENGDALADSVAALFRKMDVNHDNSIGWDEFTSHVMLGLREKEELSAERQAPLKVRYDTHKTRLADPIVRIQPLVAPTRLITITDVGDVTMYDCKMTVSSTLSLLSRGATFRVNDGMLLANSSRIILATTARRFEFYHAITGRHTNTLILHNMATCLDYHIDPFDANDSHLSFGDVRGNVGHIRFSGARLSLFGDVRQDSISRAMNDGAISIDNLPPPDRHLKERAPATCELYAAHHLCKATDEVLDEIVTCVRYAPSVESLISVAGTVETALSVTNLSMGISRGAVRSAPICRACSHFDYSDDRKVILTGGADTVLRLWNPLIMPNPLVVLRGHTDAIVRVQINPAEFQGISVSASEVVKIWDLEERVCLNTLIDISNPPLFAIRRPISSILWHRGSKAVLMAFTNELSILMIQRDKTKKATAIAHDYPVAKAAYLSAHDIAATGDKNGNIFFWRVGTGAKIKEIQRAHFNSAVTCLAPDTDGSRLISASAAGEIIMWDVEAAEAIQRFMVPNPCRVRSLVCLPSGVFTLGGDGKLIKFLNHVHSVESDATLPEVRPDSSFAPAKSHATSITCSSICGNTLLASGDHEGTIIIWHLKFAVNLREFSTTTFRQAWSHRVDLAKEHAPRDLFPEVALNAPKQITAMAWMADRVKLMAHERHELHCANLVAACDGGHIAFWSAIDGELFGSFPTMACAVGDDRVGALAVSKCSSRLYTGDSRGHLKVWGITRFCISGHDAVKPVIEQQWAAHHQSINDIQLLEDRGVLLTASNDCAVRLWNIQGGKHTADYIGAFCARTSGWSLAAYRIAQSLAAAHDHAPKGAFGKKWIMAEKRVLKLKGLRRRNTVDACDIVAKELHLIAEHAEVESTNDLAVKAATVAGPDTPLPNKCWEPLVPGTVQHEAVVEEATAGPGEVSILLDGGPGEVSILLDEGSNVTAPAVSKHQMIPSPPSPVGSPSQLPKKLTRLHTVDVETPATASEATAEGGDKSRPTRRVPISTRRELATPSSVPELRPKAKDWLKERSLGRVYFSGMHDRCDQKSANRQQVFKLSSRQDNTASKLPNLCRPFSTLSLRQASLAPLHEVAVPTTVQDAILIRHGKRRTGVSVVDPRAMRTGSGCSSNK